MQGGDFLPREQAHRAETGEGESSEIHLHVLGVINLDPVNEHARMLASQTPDIHRLKASHSTIVTQLDPRETTDRLRQARGRFKLPGSDTLRNDDATGDGTHHRRLQGVGSFAMLRMTLRCLDKQKESSQEGREHGLVDNHVGRQHSRDSHPLLFQVLGETPDLSRAGVIGIGNVDVSAFNIHAYSVRIADLGGISL